MRAMATPTGQLHVNKCACIFSISILCKLTNLPVHLYLVLTYLVRFCPHKTFGYKKNLLDQMYLFFKPWVLYRSNEDDDFYVRGGMNPMRGGMPPVRGGGSMGMGGGPMMFRGMNRPIRGRMGQPMYGYGRGAMRMPMVRKKMENCLEIFYLQSTVAGRKKISKISS